MTERERGLCGVALWVLGVTAMFALLIWAGERGLSQDKAARRAWELDIATNKPRRVVVEGDDSRIREFLSQQGYLPVSASAGGFGSETVIIYQLEGAGDASNR